MKRNTPCHCDTVTKLYSNLPSFLGKNEQQAGRTKSLQGSLEEKIKEIHYMHNHSQAQLS